MGSSIAWFSTYVRRTAGSARVSRLSVSCDYGMMEYKNNKKKLPLAGKKKVGKAVVANKGNLKPKSMPMFGMQRNANGRKQVVKLGVKQRQYEKCFLI